MNLPKHLSNHLIGKHHSSGHRMGFGFVIMVLGVTMTKIIHQPFYLYVLLDIFGYALHGIGLIPVVEHLSYNKREKELEKEPEPTTDQSF